MWRRLLLAIGRTGHNGYGPEKYHFDGASLPSLLRAVRTTPLPDVPDQRPRVVYARPDTARLRAPEYVRRIKALFRRAA